MKVELLLNDDIELRTYIKELIKNEIINISRTEISETVKDVLAKKLENTYNTKTIDKLIEQVVVTEVARHLNCYWAGLGDKYITSYIDKKIKLLVDEYFKQLGLQVAKDNNGN